MKWKDEASSNQTSVGPHIGHAKRLLPMIDRCVEEIEEKRQLSAQLVDEFVKSSMFRMLVPSSLGGAELDPVTYVQVIKTLAEGDASTAWVVGQIAVCGMFAPYIKTGAREQIFSNPAAILASGPETPDSRAVVVKGGYRVTAKWNFVSGGRHSNWLGCNCPVIEEDGSPRKNKDGTPVRRAMLFPTQKAVRYDVWQVLGLKGTGSDSFSVSDLFVSEEYTMWEDPVERLIARPLYNFTIASMYGPSFAAISIGIARRMLDEFIKLAKTKTPRAAKRPLAENTSIQSEVAQAEVRLHSAETMLLTLLSDLWDEFKEKDQIISLEQRIRLRLCTTFVIHECKKIVDFAYESAGATSIFRNNPFERRFRDMHTLTQQINGHKSNFEIPGQYLLDIDPSNTVLMFRR